MKCNIFRVLTLILLSIVFFTGYIFRANLSQVAESAGRPQIGRNMRRAAELTRIADERVLEIYNALRPHRSTFDELIAIADELDNKYQAHTCAAHVREAADMYRRRKLLRGDRPES